MAKAKLERIGRIKNLLIENFTDAQVEISDLKGDGAHLELEVCTPDFGGQSLIQQHKMVYKVLENALKQEIHAVTIKTKLPAKSQ